MTTRASYDCPQSDAIVASFLDGDSRHATPALAEHLENCPRCTQVLAHQRQIDAMLASRTPTDLDDARADAFLAFLHEVPADESREPITSADQSAVDSAHESIAATDRGAVGSSPRAFWTVGRRAAAVLFVALGATLAWSAMSEEPRDDRRESSRSAESTVSESSDKGTEAPESATGPEITPDRASRVTEAARFALPTGFVLRKKKDRVSRTHPHSRRDFLRALHGSYVSGLSSRKLAAFAERTFETVVCEPGRLSGLTFEIDAGHRAYQDLGVLAAYDQDLRVACVRFYARGVVQNRPETRDVDLWLDFVCATRGSERLEIVRRLRRSKRTIASVASRLGRRAVELAGVIGRPWTRHDFKQLGAREIMLYLTRSRETGDDRCFAAMLEVFVQASRRGELFEKLASRAFVDLDDDEQLRMRTQWSELRGKLARYPDRLALSRLWMQTICELPAPRSE